MISPPHWKTHLTTLNGYPEGDTSSWQKRYAPLIQEIFEYTARPNPLISIVILAWNSADSVLECIDRIRTQSGISRDSIELILVNNGGLDAIHERIPSFVDRELRMHGNVGCSRGRNVGVAWSTGSMLCFIDDDGMIAPDYLQNTLSYFKDPKVCAIRSRIIARHHPYFTTLAEHYDRGPESVDDCLVTEGSMTIYRDLFMRLGGFSDTLYGHEGIDLTFRIKKEDPSWRILFAPDVVMAHDYIHTWSKFIDKNFRYATTNNSLNISNPELVEFISAASKRRFQGPKLTLDAKAAKALLKAARYTLCRIAKIKHTKMS